MSPKIWRRFCTRQCQMIRKLAIRQQVHWNKTWPHSCREHRFPSGERRFGNACTAGLKGIQPLLHSRCCRCCCLSAWRCCRVPDSSNYGPPLHVNSRIAKKLSRLPRLPWGPWTRFFSVLPAACKLKTRVRNSQQRRRLVWKQLNCSKIFCRFMMKSIASVSRTVEEHHSCSSRPPVLNLPWQSCTSIWGIINVRLKRLKECCKSKRRGTWTQLKDACR